ncbi:MAG: helix-hairpin-helix domain-containing protein [Saprospirales bacterium]|nr:helix-hairpin-helix domain-containing protein [Saprospirales bacterium]
MQKWLFLWVSSVYFPLIALQAQPDTLFDPAIQLEDLLQGRDEAAEEFDFQPLYEVSVALRKRPLNLNTADETELRESGLFSPSQLLQLLTYRDQTGPLLALYELQVIPGFDLQGIAQILPYLTVGGELEDLHIPLKKLLTVGRNDLFLRWKRQLEAKKGFLPTASTPFLGNPDQLYLRFRHAYENRFSIGFTGEKDPGEELFKGSNPTGFDFMSAHIFLKEYTKTFRAIALGDYSVSLGQGLILNNGFGYGKSPATMDIKRGGRILSPFTSVNEAGFFRGIAATLAWGQNWEATGFFSSHRKDANRPDSTLTISSILLAGLHRTPAEIADEKAYRETTLGGQLRRRLAKGHIAANAVYDLLELPLIRNPTPYNGFFFNGDRLLNLSIDYSWRLRNLHFFGETAWSQNNTLATVNGLLAGLDRKVDLSVLIRHYPPRYQTLHGAPFSETIANNETGLYVGIEVRPVKLLKVHAYFDAWKHPWLRFQTDLPSEGYEWLLRLTLFKKRRWEIYWQVRGESKERNDPEKKGKTNTLATRALLFSRMHFSFSLSKSIEWRTRIELGRFSVEGAPAPQTGMLFYQDFLFKPIGFPLSFTTRFGLFDTDGYDVRFYAYENGLLYNFAIPAYYDRGARFYVNVRYKGIRNLTAELRYASSFFPGNIEIGTGIDATPGNRRSEVGIQLKWSF